MANAFGIVGVGDRDLAASAGRPARTGARRARGGRAPPTATTSCAPIARRASLSDRNSCDEREPGDDEQHHDRAHPGPHQHADEPEVEQPEQQHRQEHPGLEAEVAARTRSWSSPCSQGVPRSGAFGPSGPRCIRRRVRKMTGDLRVLLIRGGPIGPYADELLFTSRPRMPIPPPVKAVLRKDLLLGGASRRAPLRRDRRRRAQARPAARHRLERHDRGARRARGRAPCPRSRRSHAGRRRPARRAARPAHRRPAAQPTTRDAPRPAAGRAPARRRRARARRRRTARSRRRAAPVKPRSNPTGTPPRRGRARAPEPAAPVAAAAAAIPATPVTAGEVAPKIVRCASPPSPSRRDDNGLPELRLSLALDRPRRRRGRRARAGHRPPAPKLPSQAGRRRPARAPRPRRRRRRAGPRPRARSVAPARSGARPADARPHGARAGRLHAPASAPTVADAGDGDGQSNVIAPSVPLAAFSRPQPPVRAGRADPARHARADPGSADRDPPRPRARPPTPARTRRPRPRTCPRRPTPRRPRHDSADVPVTVVVDPTPAPAPAPAPAPPADPAPADPHAGPDPAPAPPADPAPAIDAARLPGRADRRPTRRRPTATTPAPDRGRDGARRAGDAAGRRQRRLVVVRLLS